MVLAGANRGGKRRGYSESNMKFILEIDPNAPRDQVAQAARACLEAAVLQNMMGFRARKLPRLYESGVRYRRPEADAYGAQRILTAKQCLDERAGTCSDLCAWRAAELRVLGDARLGVEACKWGPDLRCHHGVARSESGQLIPLCPGIKLYWRRGDARIFHCEVRLPNGSAEDPSRFLGMGGKVKEA